MLLPDANIAPLSPLCTIARDLSLCRAKTTIDGAWYVYRQDKLATPKLGSNRM